MLDIKKGDAIKKIICHNFFKTCIAFHQKIAFWVYFHSKAAESLSFTNLSVTGKEKADIIKKFQVGKYLRVFLRINYTTRVTTLIISIPWI